MATLPDIKPDKKTPKNLQPKVLMANLGDGYKQRAADGINSMPEIWNLTWTNRLYADIDTLDDFFIARAGHESFDWTSLRDSESKKYICTKWRRSFNSQKRDTITATFEQVWDY